MTPDGQALLEAAEKDPGNKLTIEALADYLEERGADPSAVRALTVDGPTVLVFGLPPGCSLDLRAEVEDAASRTTGLLFQMTGHQVSWVTIPAHVTIRCIRAHPEWGEHQDCPASTMPLSPVESKEL